jgi:hypothetical protein
MNFVEAPDFIKMLYFNADKNDLQFSCKLFLNYKNTLVNNLILNC